MKLKLDEKRKLIAGIEMLIIGAFFIWCAHEVIVGLIYFFGYLADAA